MSYTVQSAQWGNEDKTSAVVFTVEAGAVAISQQDTPVIWALFQQWIKTHPVTDIPAAPSPRQSKITLLENRIAALEAKLP